MKKIISLLLVLSMCLATVPVMAATSTAPEMLLDANFDDIATNLTPSSISMKADGSVAYVTETNGGKSLLVKNRWSDTYMTYIATPSGTFWIDTSVKGEDRNVDRSMIEVYCDSTLYPTPLVLVSRSGRLLDAEGNSYGFIDQTAQHRYSVNVNMSIDRYDIYLDGKLIGERIKMPEIDVNGIKKVGFSMMKNDDAEGQTLIDYYRVYSADSLPAESEFTVPAFNTEERKLRKSTVLEAKPAGKQMYWENDFESEAINGAPSVMVDVGYKAVVVEESETNPNKVFKFESKADQSISCNFGMMAMGIGTAPESLVMQFDIKAGTMAMDTILFYFRDAAAVGSQTVNLKANGNLVLYNGTPLGANCYQKWTNVAIVTNFLTKKMDVYIDGVKKISQVDVQNKKLSHNMYHVRTYATQSAGENEHVFYYDNVKFYSGTEPLAEGEEIGAAEVKENMPVESEKWENEISESALKLDMSKFTLVPEQKREKESELLNLYDNLPLYFSNDIVFAQNTPNVWIKTAKYKTSFGNVDWDDKWRFIAPAETLAALTSETAEISGNTVTIGNLTAKVGENKITIDGTEYETEAAVCKQNGTIYIPMKEYTIYKLKKYYCEIPEGLAIIADTERDLSLWTAEAKQVGPMSGYLTLDRPNKATLKSDFEKVTGTGTHPRMFGSKDNILKIFEKAKTNSTVKTLLDNYLAYAEASLGNTFTTGGHTVKTSSFEVVEAFYVAYLYTGDKKYVDKAKELAFLITDMNGWNHETYFLDVSTWTLVSAEVYDLFYNELTQEERDRIATRVIKLGLEPLRDHYYGSYSDWPIRRGNWNTVCNGGGVVAAGLFYGDGYNDDLMLDILEKCFDSYAYALYDYNPLGGLFESGHYWEFGTEYVTRAVDMFDHVFGTSYGMTSYEGLVNCAYWPFYLGTSSGDWAFADDPPAYDYGRVNTSYACWGAYRSGDLNLQRLRMDRLNDEGGNVYLYDLLYYQDDPTPTKRGEVMQDRFLDHVQFLFMRDDAELGDEQFWVGLHAARNNHLHNQWDLGHFEYEAFGIRWAKDYGRERYDLAAVEGDGETGNKRLAFSNRAEGHSVYVIAPDDYPGQHYFADTKTREVVSKPKGAAYDVDLTAAYWTWVTEAHRGIMLTNDRKCMVVQDDITFRPEAEGEEVKWFWQTEAKCIVNDDKSVTMIRDGFVVNLYFDSNVTFDVEAKHATVLESSPKVDGTEIYILDEDTRIEVTFYADEPTVSFRCTAMPIGYEMERGEIIPVTEWDESVIPDGECNTEKASADMIYINGEAIKDFDSNTISYTVRGHWLTEGWPEITADANGTVEVIHNEDATNTAAVMITAPDGAKRVYGLTFEDQAEFGAPTTGYQLDVEDVKADSNDGNKPEWAFDNNLDTRWSSASTAPQEAWIQFDFGSEQEFDAMVLCVGMKDIRRNHFDIKVSSDGANWTTLKSDVWSQGLKQSYEIINLPLTKARYVKIQAYGADTSAYNSYTEIQFWKL